MLDNIMSQPDIVKIKFGYSTILSNLLIGLFIYRMSRRFPLTEGTVFIPFHFGEMAVNLLTNDALDPVARIPEFKVCAVSIERV